MSSSPVSSAPAAGTLTGRVALITGASSGIGAGLARAFAVAGAKLVLSGRDEKRLQAVVDSIKQATPAAEIATLTGDIGQEETNKALVELALSRFGALHIAINNAGLFRPTPLVSVPASEVDLHFDSNVKSVIYGMKYQLAAIAKSATKDNWGVILNNSSSVSTRVKDGYQGFSLYAATKSAVDTLTKFAALEGAPSFVRVNAFNAGMTRTEGTLALPNLDDFEKGALLVQPAQSVDELAQFVLFVADNKTGRFFNGSTLLVDGGINVK